MVLPRIEMRLRARSAAAEQVLGWIEEHQNWNGENNDQFYAQAKQEFHEALEQMEEDAKHYVTQFPDEAVYYEEQARVFQEARLWSFE